MPEEKVFIQVQVLPIQRRMLQAISAHKRIKYAQFVRDVIELYHSRLPEHAKIPELREESQAEAG